MKEQLRHPIRTIGGKKAGAVVGVMLAAAGAVGYGVYETFQPDNTTNPLTAESTPTAGSATGNPSTETTLFQGNYEKIVGDVADRGIHAIGPNNIIFGDETIKANDQSIPVRNFDDSELTGSITVLDQGAIVDFKNGGSVRPIDPNQPRDAQIKEAVGEMIKQHADNPNYKVFVTEFKDGKLTDLPLN